MPVSQWSDAESDQDRDLGELYVCVPLTLAILIAVLPTSLMWYREMRRIPAGRCPKCGYDLTKNESGICPECGRIVDCGLRNADCPEAKAEG